MMQTLDGLGDSAVYAFVAYLIIHLLVNVLGYSVGIVGIVYFYKAIKWAAHCIRSCDKDYIAALKEGMDLDTAFKKPQK